MSTIPASRPRWASRRPPQGRGAPGLGSARWGAVIVAVVVAAISPFLRADDIRELTRHSTTATGSEFDLTVTTAMWFGAIANLISVGALVLLAGGLAALLSRGADRGTRATIVRATHIVVALGFAAYFLYGVWS